MIRRPAVTLMEVLIAMFIMAIGMMALLALFPVGAVSMAQALKDDRCASTASMAENVAVAWDIRHDAALTTAGFGTTTTLMYVDPYGLQGLLGPLGGTIPRVSPSFVGGSPQLADRWFSLPDDIAFLDGTPDPTSGVVDRGRRYSYAYLLRQLPPTSLVQLNVVVYSGRPVNSLIAETPLAASVTTTNSVFLNVASTTAKRGGWILSLDNGTNTYGTLGNFYRITNIVEGGGTVVLETQQNFPAGALNANVNIVIMDYVAEVFDKGTSWEP